jgi:hypothetical protein
MRYYDHSRPRHFESWIFDALIEELADDREDASGIDLVLDRLFRDGAEPLVSPSEPPARPAFCEVAELSSLLEGDDRG